MNKLTIKALERASFAAGADGDFATAARLVNAACNRTRDRARAKVLSDRFVDYALLCGMSVMDDPRLTDADIEFVKRANAAFMAKAQGYTA